jgi:hypothetical protein
MREEEGRRRTARGERTKRKIKGVNRKVDKATVWDSGDGV